MSILPLRPGDVPITPHAAPGGEARLTFIGRVHSVHATTVTAPKNPAKARAQGSPATLAIYAPFRPGLAGLAAFSHVIVLGWLHEARRDLIQITRPSELAPDAPVGPAGSGLAFGKTGQLKAQATGVFALRSPVRPNPISVSVARILSVDMATGLIEIDAIDLLDGTPLVDLKSYRPGIDAIPDAVVP